MKNKNYVQEQALPLLSATQAEIVKLIQETKQLEECLRGAYSFGGSAEEYSFGSSAGLALTVHEARNRAREITARLQALYEEL